MTIEDSEAVVADAQDSKNGIPSSSKDDLESLVRLLANQSTQLAERVALLEGERREDQRSNVNLFQDASDGGGTKIQRIEHISSTGICPPVAESLEITEGEPEQYGSVEEALDDRFALIERRLEKCEDVDEKVSIDDEQQYELSESTFSLLVTHHPLSIPFAFAVFSVALSISCLCLTLASSISKGTKGNPLGIPAGVDVTVRAAQFLGALVGVLMEDEIPQGLQLIANAAGHTLSLNGERSVRKEVLISSIFRLIVGYLFLSSLFINIAQNNDVIEIFYDVLALEFVENMDDTTFALAKRGFFGRRMLMATNQKYNLQMTEMRQIEFSRGGNRTILDNERRLSFSGKIASNNRVNYIVRFIYFLNALIILVGLGYITHTQKSGHYRARSVSVLFDEVIWEDANVLLDDGSIEQRLLIYSYFNGIYREDGTHDGYPRYVETSKNDHYTAINPSSRPGAELIYCDDIGSWVFMHQDIMNSPDGKDENECSWLWRSFQTDDYDIRSTSEGAWEAWVGKVKPLVQISITDIECSEHSDCNYHGSCVNSMCACDDLYYGYSCEFELPCPSLASEKAHSLDPTRGMQWNQENPIDEVVGHRVYNRPLYIQTGLSGEPFDMRLYKILEKEKSDRPSNLPSYTPSTLPSHQPTFRPSVSSAPSTQPSQSPSISTQPTNLPSISTLPTPFPSQSPTPKPSEPLPPAAADLATYEPTLGGTPTVGTNKTLSPTYDVTSTFGTIQTRSPTSFPTGPIIHSQNEYDEAPDFADWDDFFESTALHDLDDILEDYSVVISYSGSRFYGTIVDPDASIDDLFPQNYHAFWSQSFDVNRTFIISDTTFSSTPVGVDFFEMRRRVANPLINPNVDFSYGPYGALIPLMDYEGTGFFHCFDTTPNPSTSPSSSPAPTTSFQPSQNPTETTIPSTSPSFRPTKLVCESATSMKQCIEQPCRWDIENGTCVARTPSPTTDSAVSTYSPSTPWPTFPPIPDTPEQSSQTAFVCPDASDVGCTAVDPVNPTDECQNLNEPCPSSSGTTWNADAFCCRDGCPRNYCTLKQGRVRTRASQT